MSEETPSIIKQPITLAVIVAAVGLATLGWFLSPTSEVEEAPVAIVEPEPIVPAVPEVVEIIEVEPEPVAPEEITPVIVEPPITADTADEEARKVVDSLNAGKPAAQFVAGDYVVERAVALADAGSGVSTKIKACFPDTCGSNGHGTRVGPTRFAGGAQPQAGRPSVQEGKGWTSSSG